jgi:basic amino acid/polyamine antiporter, APA family
MINSMIGSGIFGVPGELLRMLGAASPIACVAAGLMVGIIVACFVEVGSQFSESGGPYLYVRTAFGRLAGIQVAWFTALTALAAAAAQAALFVSYLGSFVPTVAHGALRALAILGVIGLPVAVNLVGVRAGKTLSSMLVVAKLTPLLVLIAVGLLHTRSALPPNMTAIEPTSTAAGLWFSAVLVAVFSFGGFEDALSATGEVEKPRYAVPFALGASLVVCIIINTLIQWVTASTLRDPGDVERPLFAVASVLLGPWGGTLVSMAALISTSGAISATVLAVPRLVAALGEHGDLPAAIARVQRSGTPVIATWLVASVVAVLGVTGTFKWALAVTAGSMTIFAGAVCAALPRLRARQPQAALIRVPGGGALAYVGVALSVLLLIQLEAREIAAIAVTAAVAFSNWLFVKGKTSAVK